MGKKGSCMSTSSNELMVCRIMQKFRPIAPKPLSGDGKALSNGVVITTKKATGRVKRKYSTKKDKKNTLFTKNEELLLGNDKSGSKDDHEVVTSTTLQLLPLNSESSQIWKCLSSSKSSVKDVQSDQVDELSTLLKCPYGFMESSSSSPGGKQGMKEKVIRVAETLIIVECITGVCMEFHNNLLLGLSDNEKINHLQLDLSPCFVSDHLDNVVFVNEAYKKMVMKNNFLENNYKLPTELKVELVMKERVPIWFPKAFSCTARLIEYKWWRGQPEKFSRTVPCDVWRMDIGGFAWKLDIKTALGLAL